MSDFTLFEIPLTPGLHQRFSVSLAGELYIMVLRYREVGGAGWVLDMLNPDGTYLFAGKPLTTGRDLLEQFAYLSIGGALVVQSDADPTAVPTFENIGATSHLYFIPAS